MTTQEAWNYAMVHADEIHKAIETVVSAALSFVDKGKNGEQS
jgi:hypothetical protein